jgi:hypothetical protein
MNSISLTILKWLRVKFLSWTHLHNSTLLSSVLGFFNTVRYQWLHHIPSSADVTMENKACTLRLGENNIMQ